MTADEPAESPAGLRDRIRSLDVSATIRNVAIVLGVGALIFSALRVNEFFDVRDDSRRAAEAAVIDATEASAAAVDRLLADIESTVDDVADGLTTGTVDDHLADRLAAAGTAGAIVDPIRCVDLDTGSDDLEPTLCAAAQRFPEMNGIGVVFATAADPGTTYRPYANRIAGPLIVGELTQRDFETTDWYVNAVEEGGAWTHPRFGLTSLKLLAYYGSPFYDADGAVRGVVLATYALDRLAADLRWLSVGSTGYSIILSDQGKVVSHPSEDLVKDELLSSERLGEDFRPVASTAVADLRVALETHGESGFVDDLDDDLTGKPAWLGWAPIETVGWTYGSVIVEREVNRRTAEQNRLLVDAGMALLAGLLLLGVWVFGAHRGGNRSLWAVSILAGALAVAGVGWIWYLTLTGPGEDLAQATDVASPTESTYDAITESRAFTSAETPTKGPLFAGVFVQSVEFTGTNDVTVSGIVWQEQHDDAGEAEPPGFVFPEADEVTIVEEYRATDGHSTRVGWSFTASLRQTFDYSRYPLDTETVWLRLWPADYAASFLMLPELSSYETLAPSTKPGIERDFVVEGWETTASSFSYRDNSYNTDFGLRNVASDATPELYFNVHLKRSFLDAAMSQLIPLSVVAILLFSVLLITTRRDEDEGLDFSSLGVLGYCAALFFVVILSHEQLRSKLNSGEIIYLEYFYFATYAAILFVSANAILVGARRGGRLIEYRNNLVPSLLYWPALNGVILAVTLLTFY